MKVMIADDDPASRSLLQGFLSKRGFEVTEAVDGQDAMEKIYDITPKALLLDVSMPRMTGLEVLAELAQKPIEDLKIFMLTGFDGEDETANMKSAGADMIFAKPYDLKNLLDELNALNKS
ncbi:MAG: response regulator [SAR324 cluster bacterium]|nr:response regulator [SAR324 cluster bacterium]